MRKIVGRPLILFLLMLAFASSCTDQSTPVISFYYWRTTFSLSKTEAAALKGNGVTRLYVRYFDIDYTDSKGAFPRAPIRFQEKPQAKVVPVIYIKNQVFLSKVDVAELARKTVKLIAEIEKSAGIKSDEIQLDCDWTESTRQEYFRFIKAIRAVSNRRISATIRLHQIKYPDKTSIPDVDRGVLMYYNMSAVGSVDKNSIYDRKTALRYIKSLKAYPLTLDVALPIYGWGVLYRDGRPLGLKRKEDLAGVEENPDFVIDGTDFKVRNNHYFHGTYYQKGDVIKIEAVSQEQLAEMAEDLSEALPHKPTDIIFYDLDDFNLNRYDKDIFSKTAGDF